MMTENVHLVPLQGHVTGTCVLITPPTRTAGALRERVGATLSPQPVTLSP